MDSENNFRFEYLSRAECLQSSKAQPYHSFWTLQPCSYSTIRHEINNETFAHRERLNINKIYLNVYNLYIMGILFVTYELNEVELTSNKLPTSLW